MANLTHGTNSVALQNKVVSMPITRHRRACSLMAFTAASALPACPTYVLWREEMDSPRGRIYMMAKATQGGSSARSAIRTAHGQLFGLHGCMTACPSGVKYDRLIEGTRFQIERNIPRSVSDSTFRKLLFAIFPYPKRLRVLAFPMLFPKHFVAMESLSLM